MTKSELVNEISADTGLELAQCKRILESAINQIQRAVSEDEQVIIRGFGIFKPVLKKAKQVRDIGRGTQKTMPARIEPVFKAYDQFRNLCK